jgi:HTH-type transcriptional regulator/antitoxin HigA
MPATRTKSPRRPSRDTYIELVRRFPLRPIKNDNEHAQASAILSELMGRDLDAGSGDYLDALIVFVNKYEDEHHAIDEHMTPQEALRALMSANGLRQADIGKMIGSESAVSMFLAGDRGLSKSQIKKLAERFKIDPTVFLGC